MQGESRIRRAPGTSCAAVTRRRGLRGASADISDGAWRALTRDVVRAADWGRCGHGVHKNVRWMCAKMPHAVFSGFRLPRLLRQTTRIDSFTTYSSSMILRLCELELILRDVESVHVLAEISPVRALRLCSAPLSETLDSQRFSKYPNMFTIHYPPPLLLGIHTARHLCVAHNTIENKCALVLSSSPGMRRRTYYGEFMS